MYLNMYITKFSILMIFKYPFKTRREMCILQDILYFQLVFQNDGQNILFSKCMKALGFPFIPKHLTMEFCQPIGCVMLNCAHNVNFLGKLPSHFYNY